jgi:aspartyl/asparaginyl-tRNA synthetase
MYSKRFLLIGLLAIFVLTLGTAAFAFTAPKAEGLDVDTVYSDPFAYKGEIKVRGAVAGLEPEKNRFLVIDYKEYVACQSVACPAKWITVSAGGKLPESGKVVEIKGAIEKDESAKGGFVLKASEVKVK